MDGRRFLLNSDYPTPSFVAKWSGSFNVGGYNYLDTSFDHGLPFIPLLIGQWSLSSDFSPSYDIATTNGYFVGVNFNQATGSNTTKIKFSLDNGYSSARTFYYRVFAFCPGDYDGDVPAIEDTTMFRLDTDSNYHKLVEYGHKKATSTGDMTFPHNLGYLPQTRTWVYDSANDMVTPFVNIHYQGGLYTSGTIVNESNLIVKNVTKDDEIYYHIYADEV